MRIHQFIVTATIMSPTNRKIKFEFISLTRIQASGTKRRTGTLFTRYKFPRQPVYNLIATSGLFNTTPSLASVAAMTTRLPFTPRLILDTSEFDKSFNKSFDAISLDSPATKFDVKTTGEVRSTPWSCDIAGRPPLITPVQTVCPPTTTDNEASGESFSETGLI